MRQLFSETKVRFYSSDKIGLEGILCRDKKRDPAETPIAIMIHGGGGVDRNEDGFFSRLSVFLLSKGIASLRFNHRAYLAVQKTKLEVTISGMANDITKAIIFVSKKHGFQKIHLVAASFGSGAGLIANNDNPSVLSNVLINPLIDYKDRLLKEKRFWKEDSLTAAGARELEQKGFLRHGSTLKMKRPLINEIARMEYPNFWSAIKLSPTLIIHGTKDSRISHLHSLNAQKKIANIRKVELIEGADHGLCLPDDDNFEMTQTKEWHNYAYGLTCDWIIANTNQ